MLTRLALAISMHFSVPSFPIVPTIIIGENNLEPVENLPAHLYEYGESVARMESNGGGRCTATRVAKDLFLTNNHCATSCGGITFKMGYERDKPVSEQSVFSCKQLVSTNPNLDYALFRVGLPTDEEAWPIAQFSALELFNGLELLMPGHPAGRKKEADQSAACKIIDIGHNNGPNRPSMKHGCDSEGGNSGSSVRDRRNGWIVGLHWGTKFTGANGMIPASLILTDIKSKAPEAYEQLSIIGNLL